MEILDGINGMFQLGAGFALSGNVVASYKAKTVKGVSIWTQLYMVIWGFSVIPFFFSLNQYFSVVTSIFILIVNSIWLFQIIYYNKREQNKMKEKLTMPNEN